MWSKKWYLKMNISCDAHLLNELLDMDVPWDDAIVVSAGKLRKLWDSLSELRSSVCQKTTEKDSSEACATACQNCAVYSVFPSGMTSHSKIAQFNWECIGRFTGLQLVKKFPAFYGTRKFITSLTRARHLSLSWTSSIQCMTPHPSSWRSILILSFHQCLGLPSGFLHSGLPTKILHAPILSTILTTRSASRILLDLINRIIFGEIIKLLVSYLSPCALPIGINHERN